MEHTAAPLHVPVMVEETVQALAVQPGGRYIDCTVGVGGHARAILEHAMPGGQLLGIDLDPAAIQAARKTLSPWRKSFVLVNDSYANLESICARYNFFPVHGALFDLGLSSLQLAAAERGFSFSQEGPLDMRFGPTQKITAEDIINDYSKQELAEVLRTYGEERQANRIADFIVNRRPVRTTTELARIVELATGGRRGKIHPATRTFQALRIAVNEELERLETGLQQAINVLGSRGRLVVISYHSLEDRIVKRFMQQESRGCICPPEAPTCTCDHTARLRLITRKVVTASQEELRANPRSRSAKLRTAERIMNHEEYCKTLETGLCRNNGEHKPEKPARFTRFRAEFSIAA